MVTRGGSFSPTSPLDDVDPTLEYYEEVDNHTLDFQKRKAPTTIVSEPTTVVREPTPIVDPVTQLNEHLNRQFRPDLVLPTPSRSPTILPIIQRTPSPNPIIYDARTKPIKSSKKKKEPSISVKQKLFNRIHQLPASTVPSTSYPSEILAQQHTSTNGYQIPPDLILVPTPQQQQTSIIFEPSQQFRSQTIMSQYTPPTVTHSNSIKRNKVAPPPVYNFQTSTQSLPYHSYQNSTVIPTNPLVQSSYTAQQKAFKSTNPTTKKSAFDPAYTDRSFALYNQKNGRIEGVIKNRLNVATDNAKESRIIDDESKPTNKWALWFSQPLCLGLKRLNGGLLFGTMILLGTTALAGLIASSVTYGQDNVTDAQWKILGIVICTVMLIAIIVTLMVFICCYKYGYMFNKDDMADQTGLVTTQDADGNEQQKAVLRKIYKFNRPNDSPPNIIHSTPTPVISQSTVQINDKQTNTETTIAPIRPKDFDRGVWPSINAYGGIRYRPINPPQMVSRFIQVLPHEIEETYHPSQIIYQVIAPPRVPSPNISPRIIEISAEQAPIVEVIEKKTKQPRMTLVRQPPTTTRIEYVDVEETRPHRIVQQPHYEIVEEIIDRSMSSTPEEIFEIVDESYYPRGERRKKEGRKQGFGNVSVKHVKEYQ